MTRGASTKWPDLLQAIVRRLDRGGSPDSHFPDRDGEYWALCPFHPDRHPNNFSVSEAGYHCFACGASGGLWGLAEKLGVTFPYFRGQGVNPTSCLWWWSCSKTSGLS